MRCITLNACKIFCTNFPGCHPPLSYSRRHTLSDYAGGPLCQSGHGYPSRYLRPAAALLGEQTLCEMLKKLSYYMRMCHFGGSESKLILGVFVHSSLQIIKRYILLVWWKIQALIFSYS